MAPQELFCVPTVPHPARQAPAVLTSRSGIYFHKGGLDYNLLILMVIIGESSWAENVYLLFR